MALTQHKTCPEAARPEAARPEAARPEAARPEAVRPEAALTKTLPKPCQNLKYRTRAIIGRSRFEAALVYKPRILGLKNEEFPFLVHKLSVI